MPPKAQTLRNQARRQTTQIQSQIQTALTTLANTAAQAVIGAGTAVTGMALVAQVIAQMALVTWGTAVMLPVLFAMSRVIIRDTEGTMDLQFGLPNARAVEQAVESTVDLASLEDSVRRYVTEVIMEGLAAGDTPERLAQRLRDVVPQGPWVNAGVMYRSHLIASEAVKAAQRETLLQLAERNPDVSRVRIVDGIYGPPRSDSECIARNGDVVTVEEARMTHPYHPNCTLQLIPE